MKNSSEISRTLTLTQLSSLPEPLTSLPHIQLANLPTPIQELRRLSDFLGAAKIYIKRDDLTGLATGGNKTRKLEYLIGDALKQGADCVITAGAVQSNHCRQTAAAAAHCGLECHLVFGGKPPSNAQGNYLLDQLLGAQFHWTEKQLRSQKIEEVAENLRQAGKRPYPIPIGGSNYVGAMGYVAAMFELVDQLRVTNLKIDRIVYATSSGGTQAGMVLGAALTGFAGELSAISIDQVPDDQCDEKYQAFVLDIVNSGAKKLNLKRAFQASDIKINYDYLGKGYGVVGDLERQAVRLIARTEGILVGPVYTGRVLGALVDLLEKGSFKANENILFWHTGDEVALHAYSADFAE